MANLQNLFPKAVNVLGERLNPERSLWRNVLIVALEDAIGKHWKNKNLGIANSHLVDCDFDVHTKRARAYFLEPNRDFVMVCQYAGFDYEYIRMKAKQFFNSGKSMKLYKKRRKNEENMQRL
jgi:hypothetical protein|tara:strand:- start:47 stop:412 length:366 start_codon:yes stop_codon:yes gene_type:complete